MELHKKNGSLTKSLYLYNIPPRLCVSVFASGEPGKATERIGVGQKKQKSLPKKQKSFAP